MPDCSRYREEMLLAALRRQLQNEPLSERQRREIQRRIAQLEREMGMD